MVFEIAALSLFFVCWDAGAANAADAAAGETVFQRCTICHTAERGGENGIGPNLFGVVGRKSASRSDFSYSAALKSSGITWTDDKLGQWVAGPAKVVPGTKMVFAGITSKTDAANLIAYLDSLK